MSSEKNTREIQLLETAPDRLVAQYQYIIEAVVSKFIGRGYFQGSEKMDLVQMINTQLLEGKMKKIQENFNGSVYLSTYFSKVVYNACLEFIRSEKRKPKTTSDEVLATVAQSEISAYEKLVIRDEVLKLEAIIKSFGHRKAKTVLCLKLYARIILNNEGLHAYANYPFKEELRNIRNTFFNPYEDLKDKEVYKIVIPLFNKVEEKNGDPDSLRKWINMIVDRMIDVLNGVPPNARYSRDTLKILMQMFWKN